MRKRILWFCLLILMLTGCVQTRVEGKPDCVSSSSYNDELHLTIIANRNEIEDQETFAEEIFEMCKNNSFKSMMLSTDIHGFPKRIEAEIYMWEEEIRREEPALIVEYAILSKDGEYNVKLIM